MKTITRHQAPNHQTQAHYPNTNAQILSQVAPFKIKTTQALQTKQIHPLNKLFLNNSFSSKTNTQWPILFQKTKWQENRKYLNFPLPLLQATKKATSMEEEPALHLCQVQLVNPIECNNSSSKCIIQKRELALLTITISSRTNRMASMEQLMMKAAWLVNPITKCKTAKCLLRKLPLSMNSLSVNRTTTCWTLPPTKPNL